MPVENRREAFTMRRLQQMHHFMDDNIFEQVFRLLHELRVQADVASAVVAAAPPGLHSLKKVTLHLHAKFRFPFPDQSRHHLVEQRLVPLVHDLGAFLGATSRAHGERDASVVKANAWPGVRVGNGKQIAPPPKIVAFARDELPGCFARLFPQLVLLLADPGEFADGVGAGHVETSCSRSNQRDAAIGRVHREMDMLDAFPRHLDRKLPNLNRLVH